MSSFSIEAARSKALPQEDADLVNFEVDEAFRTLAIEGEEHPRLFLQFDNRYVIIAFVSLFPLAICCIASGYFWQKSIFLFPLIFIIQLAILKNESYGLGSMSTLLFSRTPRCGSWYVYCCFLFLCLFIQNSFVDKIKGANLPFLTGWYL